MARLPGTATIGILAALESRVRYGLDIVERTKLQPGTVYTTLRRLEQKNLVEGEWEDAEIAEAERRPRRRYYTLTRAGSVALADARERIAPFARRAGRRLRPAAEESKR